MFERAPAGGASGLSERLGRTFLRDFQEHVRILGRDHEKSACSTRWSAATLLPLLERPHRYAEQRRKLHLGEPGTFSNGRYRWNSNHASNLAALQLA